ncbi:alpha/beta hydrolase [Flavobacterium supellecticarium]|uniref:Alpha/beta hydrolase n=1 Tax=Flavobacterium supellecticarium TaxID=2565924 RepID=A0A4S3ZRI2_9FLAO|nr:alpha/beta hydrolase-fold protein [Flavobacterium supellecticarium]THF48222.1 alpha/beta hydrolase [Flavobacterium supellecticarium]
MKQTLLLLATFLLSHTLFSQRTVEAFNSEKLKEIREVTIITPDNYESNKDKKYPLLLVLDGEYLTNPFYGVFSYGAYWDDLPEVIIVAINQNKNNEREHDSSYDEGGLPNEQGAKFFEFIGAELLPYVEKKYRVAPFRMIAGLDTTAGFLNFFLYKDNPIFNAYISLSPEFAPEMENRIPERLAAIQKPIFYYQATSDGDLKKIQTKMKTLDEKAKAVTNSNLKYRFDEFKGLSHYSLVTFAIPNAAYHIFDGYQPISTIEFQEKIAKLPTGHTQYLIDKYNNLEKKLGYKPTIRLNDFKAIEAAILKNKNYEELLTLSEVAKKNYPKSMISEYEKGLYYENTNDNKKAYKAYMSAFNQEPIGDLTKDGMLERADAVKSR